VNVLAQGGLKEKETPPAWLTELARLLRSVPVEDAAMLRPAVAAARALSQPKVRDSELLSALLNAAQSTKAADELRLEAFAVVSGSLGTVPPELFNFVRSNLESAGPVNARNAAAAGLSKATLTTEQLLALTESLKDAGPLEIPKLLSAFEKSRDEAVGLKLVAALKQVKGSSLRLDLFKSTLTNYPVSVQAQGEELIASLNIDAGKQKAHLESLLAEVHGKGDVRRGQAIFNSAKAACLSCHAIGYQGGKVGPDLTRISEVRSERDLLEAIVYPSASFVRSYEPVIVSTKDGEEHSGVLRRDAPDEVLLATGPTTEMRIARSDISEMRPGAVSVMPQGLDEQLTRQELADLLTFLKNTKWGPQ
jgi:putative heme-binding domain-containing protein